MNRYDERMKQLIPPFKYLNGEKPEFRTLSEDELGETENEIGYALPCDYREFLRDYGEAFVGTGIRIPEPRPNHLDEVLIESFHGVAAKHPEKDLMRNFHLFKQLLPAGFCPIAVGNNGHWLLNLNDEQKGSVYFLDSSDAASYKSLSDDLYLIANSFDEFMCYLEPRSR